MIDPMERAMLAYRQERQHRADWLDAATVVAMDVSNGVGTSRYAEFIAAVKREEGLA